MRFLNDEQRYGLVSKLLHWSMALTMIGLIWLGWYMVDLSYYDRWYNKSLAIHRSAGIVVFVIGVLLLIWKMISKSPEQLASLPNWQKIAARIVHGLLLFGVILLPITGYVISTSAGKPIDMFGYFEIPPFIVVSQGLRDLAIACHFYLAYGVGVIVLGHAGAALKHQFIDRDGTLAKMIWR